MRIDDWNRLRKAVRATFLSSYHFAVATVGPDGAPHVAPMGSLLLGEPGHAIVFQKFIRQTPRNWESDPKVCILGVDSSRWLWLRALFTGRFPTLPAFRLRGEVVGPPRPATPEEIRRFRRRLGWLARTRGGDALWGGMAVVRDLRLDEWLPVQMGSTTRHLA